MLVNRIDIAAYNAVLISKDIETVSVTIYDDWLRNALNPLYLGKLDSYKKIKIQLFIRDDGEEEALTDISNLISQLEKCTIKFDDLDFYYDCLITDKSHERITTGIYTLDVELKSGYAYKSSMKTNFTGKNVTVNLDGNIATPAIVSIKMPIDTVNVVLTGLGSDTITVKNLHKDIPVIIDGEAYTVLENGSNKFNDVDIWEFPVLQPGANVISMDNDNAAVEIQYKPRWK